MKTIYAYLRALLNGSRICWAEAGHEARNMISIGQVISETIDRLFLRIACAVQTYKLFLRVNVGAVVERGLVKVQTTINKSAIGRYFIRALKAETNLCKIVSSRHRHC